MIVAVFLALLTIIGLADNTGVGSGRNVYVTQYGNVIAWTVTQDSQATVDVPFGTYDVEIAMPKFNPFFEWICEDEVTVNQAEEYLVIHCVRWWRLKLPFLRGN